MRKGDTKVKFNMKNKKKPIAFFMIIGFFFLLLLIIAKYDWNQINSYEAYNTETLSYAKARVTSVSAENLVKDEMDDSRYLGTQDITVEILEGKYKGEEITICNNLSRTLNVYVREGQKVIIRVDDPENAEAYFSVYSYDREGSIWFMAILFVAILFCVGGIKGIRALVGLGVTVGYIFLFLVPAIYHGGSVQIVTTATIFLVIVAAIFILNGFQKKTLLSIVATFGGVLMAGGLCLLLQKLLLVSGYNLSDMEALVLVSKNTGLEIKNLLFAAVLISSLGAVMDVAVSVVSALWEVNSANENLTGKQLFQSGMNIGKDMIGTMSNTLILAFMGTSLTTVLLLIAYGYQTTQLLNSDYIALELVQAASSTFAVILTVPLASLISSIGIKRKVIKEKK